MGEAKKNEGQDCISLRRAVKSKTTDGNPSVRDLDEEQDLETGRP